MITLNGTSGLTLPGSGTGVQVGSLTSGTAQATTSGTAINFTGIPNWVKRVTVILQNVSGSGTSSHLIRLGTSSGVVSTGYLSTASSIGATPGHVQFTTGFGLSNVIAASRWTCIVTICNISSNTWVQSFSGAYNDAAFTGVGGGYLDLGGTLDRIQLTTVNGTDTFDSGLINIMYE